MYISAKSVCQFCISEDSYSNPISAGQWYIVFLYGKIRENGDRTDV